MRAAGRIEQVYRRVVRMCDSDRHRSPADPSANRERTSHVAPQTRGPPDGGTTRRARCRSRRGAPRDRLPRRGHSESRHRPGDVGAGGIDQRQHRDGAAEGRRRRVAVRDRRTARHPRAGRNEARTDEDRAHVRWCEARSGEGSSREGATCATRDPTGYRIQACCTEACPRNPRAQQSLRFPAPRRRSP